MAISEVNSKSLGTSIAPLIELKERKRKVYAYSNSNFGLVLVFKFVRLKANKGTKR